MASANGSSLSAPLRPTSSGAFQLCGHLAVIHAFLASPNASCDLCVAAFPIIDRWRALVHARSSAIHRSDAAPLAPTGVVPEVAVRPTHPPAPPPPPRPDHTLP